MELCHPVTMPEPHAVLNALAEPAAAEALRRCCAAERWVAALLALRPYASSLELHACAERAWQSLEERDYLEAFSHHPQIGQDLASLRQRFNSTHTLAEGEQAGVHDADEATLHALREGNRAYRARFGYIFIVCATGKSAAEMLHLLQQRIGNDPATELRLAAAEQAKITRLRLDKLGLEGQVS
jgi:2-oxo-4-hydroxy-4-carboxy-5-ureidoimidazoline decarboxylase